MPSYVVVGASRGLGLEFVNQLSAEPSNAVFALVRSLSTAGGLVELAASRSNIKTLVADITDVAALRDAASAVDKAVGSAGLDVLIINGAYVQAGKTRGLPMTGNGDEESLHYEYVKSFEINVLGPIHTTNIFLPLLRRGATKKVITISSARGDLGFTRDAGDPTAGPYGTSKHAVNFAMAKYAVQFRDEGFVFLALAPGLVDTAANAIVTPEDEAGFAALVTVGKKLYPQWNGKMTTPKESVELMLGVIERFGPERSGEFVSQFGNQQWV